MEEKGDKAKAPNLIGQDYFGKRFGYKIPNGYEFDCIKNNEIILKPKQPEYPKSYIECTKILDCFSAFHIDGYKNELIKKLQELLICRDAYWKIAGEEMGLGKPWEPDLDNDKWPDLDNDKWLDIYYISFDGKHLKKKKGYPCCNMILIFPTEEMRDAFYENFMDLIEECKEFL